MQPGRIICRVAAPIALLAWLMLLMQGCSPPVKQLTAYRQAFEGARASTEEFILTAKNDVNTVADSPVNKDAAKESDRKKQLAALDERLHALDAVTAFNNALVALATNSDPAEIQGDLKTFTTSITHLIPQIAGAAGPLGAATGAVSDAVSLIEAAMREQKFKQVVAQADKVVPPLLEFLTTDVRYMFNARWALTLDEYVDAKADFQKSVINARLIMNRYADAPTIQEYFARINTQRANAVLAPANPFIDNAEAEPPLQPVKHQPGTQTWADTSDDNVLVGGFVSDAGKAQARMAEVAHKLVALQELESKYRDQMQAVGAAFEDLVAASQAPHVDLTAATNELTADVRDFRQAYLAFKEAK